MLGKVTAAKNKKGNPKKKKRKGDSDGG